ncbi:MAG: hypothetical protein M1376_20925 [Planctomycetes bacterium]|nr:hypothetical protein [Planctomycetota bacterium]
MRIVGAVLVGALCVSLAGCGSPEKGAGRASEAGKAANDGRVFFTVDFQPGETLRYKFTSKKNIAVDWDPNAATKSNHVQEQSETFEMIVAYTPVEVDPYGVSTICATVESVRAVRSGGPSARNFGTDAVESAQGKSFALKVDPRGKIVDASELATLIQEMGKQAFRAGTAMGRVKEPDMIGDFIASQWFLWDAESSLERPAEGVAVGQTWRSQLSVPTPMVMRQARNVVYQLDEARQDADGSFAVITSTYTPAESVPAGWPIPYAGRFQMSGTFGFLGPYEVLGLEGTGTELFNLKTGRIEERQQKYVLRVKAGLPPLGIKANPHITIEQTLTMERQ